MSNRLVSSKVHQSGGRGSVKSSSRWFVHEQCHRQRLCFSSGVGTGEAAPARERERELNYQTNTENQLRLPKLVDLNC